MADIDMDNKVDGVSTTVKVDDVHARDGFAMGLAFRYAFENWFFVGVNLDYSTLRVGGVDLQVGDQDFKYNFGRSHTVSLTPLLEFRWPQEMSERKILPYFFVGGGMNFNLWDNPDDRDLSIEIDPSFGILVGGGVEFFVSPLGSILLEIGWHNNVAGFEANRSGRTRYSGDLDISDVRITMGFRSYF